MKRRQRDQSNDDIIDQLQPLVDDDAFLTELSQGIDPSEGKDPLAALFLELREDVEKQMPPAPIIEGADQEPFVISLAERRRTRSSRPFVSGLIGAAAATLLIAGTGTAIYSATPGSPLWGVSSSMFSDRAAVVELAGALEEIDSKAAEGDIDGTRALLEEARKLVDKRVEAAPAPSEETTVTTTVVRTVAPQAPAEATQPETVTETVVQTETAVNTVTVTHAPPVRENPLPIPTDDPALPPVVVTTTPAVDPTLAPPQIQDPSNP